MDHRERDVVLEQPESDTEDLSPEQLAVIKEHEFETKEERFFSMQQDCVITFIRDIRRYTHHNPSMAKNISIKNLQQFLSSFRRKI